MGKCYTDLLTLRFGLLSVLTKPLAGRLENRGSILCWDIRGGIQNIPDWCRHLYSSCGSAKHRWMVGLPCLVSQCAKLHVAGWKWAVSIRDYFYDFYSAIPEYFGYTLVYFIFITVSRSVPTPPVTSCQMDAGCPFPEIKRTCRGNCSHRSNDEVNNAWICTSSPEFHEVKEG
jgi:hypothetical protein